MRSDIHFPNFAGIILAEATACFNEITSVPKEISGDEKPRTGIQLYLAEPDTQNFLFLNVLSPSPRAQTLAVKKLFSRIHWGIFPPKTARMMKEIAGVGA